MSQGKEQTVLGESALSRYSDLSLKAYSQSVSVDVMRCKELLQSYLRLADGAVARNVGWVLGTYYNCYRAGQEGR